MTADKIQSLEPRPQLAALPWRRANGRVEVLMVTSRVSRHWLIPKGWPMKGKRHAEAAAIEAFEEAGVRGRISSAPIGSYGYLKLLPGGDSVPCRVDVYGLEVRKELGAWPEQASRERSWMEIGAAAMEAYEPELARLLTGLTPEALEQERPRRAKR